MTPPVTPLLAMATTDGTQVKLLFGYREDGKLMVQYERTVPFADVAETDDVVQAALAEFQAVQDRINTLNRSFEPSVLTVMPVAGPRLVKH